MIKYATIILGIQDSQATTRYAGKNPPKVLDKIGNQILKVTAEKHAA